MLGPLPAAHRAGLVVAALTLGALLGLCLALTGATMGTLAVVSPSMAAALGAVGSALVATTVLVGWPLRRGA